MCIRIYVASLAKYNEGRLVGRWIDLPCDDLWKQVEEMLDDDEEWAIHDYEAPFSISEYEDLDQLNEVAELEEEYDLPRLAYLVDQGYDLDQALEKYEDVTFYRGMSLEDVAVSLVEDGIFGTIPDNILCYFDFEKLARDLDIDGYDEQDAGVFCYH
ncbi:antirestriction protein ArdA [Trichlorobacter lovleyi]|uniref:antirestriction protein ArdA n=1 Tax=Trichlorobacter lovleyi TaxID=313985 RepID=UPI0023F31D70|nr:antirestriction protein ArdA [Trichlorobacter lovleyi]